jgi:cell division protein FtsI (penicillin-binding protein 3)
MRPAHHVPPEVRTFSRRVLALGGLLCIGAAIVLWRAVDLQWVNQDFLAERGAERYMRVAKVLAHRGAILDRYGEPLAVSTPVDAVLVNPRELLADYSQINRLASALDRQPDWLKRRLSSALDRQGLPLGIVLEPGQSARLKQLKIPGVFTEREYRRFYPAVEVTGHVLGFNSREDHGQEGLELAYDEMLAGEDGAKRVLRDRLGRVIENVASIRAARPGENLYTSIDLRIQYIAYRALYAAMGKYKAKSGSVVVMDVTTGEVLAMVNWPAFNPNDRAQFEVAHYRNRAALDLFEPGSSIKPFIVAAALQSGRIGPQTVIDTNPGSMQVGPKHIEDKHNYGRVTPAQILAKSSNVGMIKIALGQRPIDLWTTLTRLGFGQVTASGFPGEAAGLLQPYATWRPIAISSMAYGYGLNVTPLQLASAYATVGALGVRRPVSFRRVEGAVPGERVLDEDVARELIGMLETVVTDEGTGKKADVRGYRVAGKTGTAWKSTAGGYSTDRYMAVFAGMVPASQPRLAAAVVIDEPSGAMFYGGDVAAPVFSEIMSGALRLMAVAPDNLGSVAPGTLVQASAP